MKTYQKTLLVLAISTVALAGAAGLVSARGGYHGGGYHGDGAKYHGEGGSHRMGKYEWMEELTPEQRSSIRQAHDAVAPLRMEYRAKKSELTAKIRGGADDKSIQAVYKELEVLHSKLMESEITLQKQMKAANVPLRGFRCGSR